MDRRDQQACSGERLTEKDGPKELLPLLVVIPELVVRDDFVVDEPFDGLVLILFVLLAFILGSRPAEPAKPGLLVVRL